MSCVACVQFMSEPLPPFQVVKATVGRSSSSITSLARAFHASARWAAGGHPPMMLNPKSLQVQVAFLASVVARCRVHSSRVQGAFLASAGCIPRECRAHSSLQVQGAFLASVVADAQRGRYVEVVTSPRGFHKSACVAAMASENWALRALFGMASPAVKIVGGKLSNMMSSSKLFDALLEYSPEIGSEALRTWWTRCLNLTLWPSLSPNVCLD
jgi:hypothetical protein